MKCTWCTCRFIYFVTGYLLIKHFQLEHHSFVYNTLAKWVGNRENTIHNDTWWMPYTLFHTLFLTHWVDRNAYGTVSPTSAMIPPMRASDTHSPPIEGASEVLRVTRAFTTMQHWSDRKQGLLISCRPCFSPNQSLSRDGRVRIELTEQYRSSCSERELPSIRL